MKRTPLPIIVGILDIMAGILSLVCFALLALISIAAPIVPIESIGCALGLQISLGLIIFLASLFLMFGAVSLVGGVYALQRRKWGWVIAGSICSLLPKPVLGLVAIILTVISRDEFE